MYTNRALCLKIRAPFLQNQDTFFYFKKRAGETFPPSPLVVRLIYICIYIHTYVSHFCNSHFHAQYQILSLFLSFFRLEKLYIAFFYPSYVSICKDLQKTIVLSSGPLMQIVTFTIQCICL